MTRLTVHEYPAALRTCYRAARKGAKGRILDEFCGATAAPWGSRVTPRGQGSPALTWCSIAVGAQRASSCTKGCWPVVA